MRMMDSALFTVVVSLFPNLMHTEIITKADC